MFRGGRNCIISIFAVSMGAGILIAAIFPTGLLMFLVATLLIASGCACWRREKGGAFMNIVVWKAPKAMCGLLRKLFKIPA